MKFLILIVLVLSFAACKEVVVRDAEVYKQEIDFIESASAEQVERGKALIKSECTCQQPVEGINVFETPQCDKMAETVLVIEARMSYHTDFMRYLGGLSEKRPPKNPPEVPETNSLCPDSVGD